MIDPPGVMVPQLIEVRGCVPALSEKSPKFADATSPLDVSVFEANSVPEARNVTSRATATTATVDPTTKFFLSKLRVPLLAFSGEFLIDKL